MARSALEARLRDGFRRDHELDQPHPRSSTTTWRCAASSSEQLSLHEGFELREAGTGKEALELAKEHPFAAVLLDVGLPDMDGRDVCRLLRKQGVKAPVIMLTAHSGDADTILGLDSGANDYITKPFRLGVLLARLRAQLRQFELSDDAVFQVGPYSFKPAAKMLVRGDNRKIHLTEKETAILKYLYRIGDRRSRARCCWTRSGATMPASPPTRSRPTSTACARRSSPSPARPRCW